MSATQLGQVTAPECDCKVGSRCQRESCCYFGSAVPANVRSDLEPGPTAATPLERIKSLAQLGCGDGTQLDQESSFMVQAIQIGCAAADIHLKCSYPECSCVGIPAAIRAVVLFIASETAASAQA